MASADSRLGGWRIDQIHVKGFKSFSGQQWAVFDVPAQARLVGITGPNGSGKSTLLEAICFATGCGTAILRGCKSLRDVTSTDSTQLPEVKIRFACNSSSSSSSSGGGSRALGKKPVERHLLEAGLTPHGTRAYKVDGRIKNGSQVKDFLRGLGIVVNPTTIIHQATVTQLADKNNAATLAELVAGASGLTTWQQESAAAQQEIARARRSLTDIQGNISTVQHAAAADEAAVQAALQAAQLQEELEAVLTQLLAGMQGQQQHEQALLQQAEQEQAALQEAMASLEQHASNIRAQLQLLATQGAAAVRELDACDSDSPGRTTRQPLTTQIAAAEAAVQAAKEAAAANAALKADLLAKQELLRQTEAQVQQLQAAAQHKRRAASQAVASLASVEAATGAAASLQQQQLETQRQLAATAAAIVQQQGAVSSSTRQLQQARLRLSCVQQSLQQTQHQQQPRGASPADAAAAVSGATQAAAAASQAIAKLQQQLLQSQMDADAADAALDSGVSGVLSAANCGAAAGSAVPLHKCFSIKAAASDRAAASNLLTALAGIAGPATLQVLVVQTAQQANQLLAAVSRSSSSSSASGSSAKLKIWPLNRLQVRSQLPAQRAAQQALGADKVMLPLDLLQYEPAHAAALARAFGSYVIAADDATAAALVERHGLSCITLDGTVSRKGSMSGGWAGSSGSYSRSLWRHKLQHDAANQRAACLQHELSTAEDTRLRLQAELLAAEQCVAAAEQAHLLQQEEKKQQAAIAAAASLLQQEEQRLQELRGVHGSLQERLGCCQAAMQSGGKRAATADPQAAAALKRQLQQDAQRAAALADTAAQELEAALDKAVELAAVIDTMQLQLASADDSQQHQQTLKQQEQQLQQLLLLQAEQQAASAALQSRVQEVAEQQRYLESQLQQVQRQQASTQQQLRAAAGRASAAAASLKQAKKELRQAVRDFSPTDAVRAFAAAGSGSSSGSGSGDAGAGSRLEVGRLGRKAHQLQGKLAQLEVADLPLAQRELLEARVAQVQQFRTEMASLADLADALEQHIQLQAEQVHAANDAVFEDVAVGFSELCSSLLPALELQLARTGGSAHEGLQFRFRCSRSAEAGADDADDADDLHPSSPTDNGSAARQQGQQQPWQTSLSMLSGGQRTLVSLAMLLAVARAGNSSGLFLLDEVDAALDEHNTARAAALLKQLAHADDGGRGCQILCVTHNTAFQHVCDGFVQVDAAGRSTGGDAAPAAGGGRATAAKKGRAGAAAGSSNGVTSKSAAKRVRFAG